jgi:PIN domain nuclease of toxin-antitoxin system
VNRRRRLIVLDTHAWILFVDDPKRLGKHGRRVIAKASRLGLAAVSLWELAMLVEVATLTTKDARITESGVVPTVW